MNKTATLVSAVKSTVKVLAQESEMRVSGEFYEQLDHAVTELVSRSILRAKQNGRQTIQPQDL